MFFDLLSYFFMGEKTKPDVIFVNKFVHIISYKNKYEVQFLFYPVKIMYILEQFNSERLIQYMPEYN